MADAEIFSAQRLRQNKNSLTKLRHRDPEIITGASSTADADIISAHRLRQTQKSLTKTESLQIQKSSPEPNSTANVEIFSAHRLR